MSAAMTTATIFAVTPEAFAMKSPSGAVILATCDGGWTPVVGLELKGVRTDVGPCIATVAGSGDPVKLSVKVRNDQPHPTYWGGLD